MRRLLAVIVSVLAVGGIIRWYLHSPPASAAFVAGEFLVRAPEPLNLTATSALNDIRHDFGDEIDKCCISEGRRTYLFHTTGDIQVAINFARAKGFWAQPNFLYGEARRPNDVAFQSQAALEDSGDSDINATEAWDSVTGDSRVAVAVVDSGVYYGNEDLKDRMWKNRDECPPNGTNGMDDDLGGVGNGYIDDCYGIDAPFSVTGGSNPASVPAGDPNAVGNNHGTKIAGVVAAHGDNETLVAGMVWDGRIVACKFYENAPGTTFHLEECLHYIRKLSTRPELKHLVAVNMSWTTSAYDNNVYCAIVDLQKEGILSVAAAGNDGVSLDDVSQRQYPAGFFLPSVIAVAETDETGEKVDASNFGRRTVHIAAPGPTVTTSIGDKPEGFQGTSSAAPHVAGLLALLEAQGLQANKDLDWITLKNSVLAGGVPRPDLENFVITRRRARAAELSTAGAQGGTPTIGALTCVDQRVRRRLRPIENHQNGAKREFHVKKGAPIYLAAMSIDCAAPSGPVQVVATEKAGTWTTTIQLDDADTDRYQVDGDGVYTGLLPPGSATEFDLTFSYGPSHEEVAGDTVSVRVVETDPEEPAEPVQQLSCEPVDTGPH